MKKTQLLISGISLLIAGIGSAMAGSFEGSLYNDLQTPSLLTSSTERGAQGPIRSVDVQQPAIDIYTSLSKYHAAQMFDKTQSERGAQGPIRSDADMAMERNRQEWKKLVGPFDGSAD